MNGLSRGRDHRISQDEKPAAGLDHDYASRQYPGPYNSGSRQHCVHGEVRYQRSVPEVTMRRVSCFYTGHYYPFRCLPSPTGDQQSHLPKCLMCMVFVKDNELSMVKT